MAVDGPLKKWGLPSENVAGVVNPCIHRPGIHRHMEHHIYYTGCKPVPHKKPMFFDE